MQSAVGDGGLSYVCLSHPSTLTQIAVRLLEGIVVILHQRAKVEETLKLRKSPF